MIVLQYLVFLTLIRLTGYPLVAFATHDGTFQASTDIDTCP